MTTKFIEPTNEHVGQMVEVSHLDSKQWKKRELVAVLPKDMFSRFVCRDMDGPKYPVFWSEARIEVPKSYAELQAESGLKVGDWVKVTRAAKSYENGWGTVWNPKMNDCIGKVFQIGYISNFQGISSTDGGFIFPFFVLEKIEKPETKEEKIDKLIRLFKEELVKIL